MRKHLIAAVVAVAGGLSAGVATAGNVYWSIGIQAPPVATVFSNAPVYQPYQPSYQPSYQPYYQPSYQPYYQPQPVYVAPPVYAPAPVYVAPPVVYRVYPPPVSHAPQVVYGGWGHGHHRHWRRDEYGSPHHGGHWAPRDERRRHH